MLAPLMILTSFKMRFTAKFPRAKGLTKSAHKMPNLVIMKKLTEDDFQVFWFRNSPTVLLFFNRGLDMGSVHDKQMVFAKELLGSSRRRGKWIFFVFIWFAESRMLEQSDELVVQKDSNLWRGWNSHWDQCPGKISSRTRVEKCRLALST